MADTPEPTDAKTLLDLVKHFTTLNTGTIVIAATVFDKFHNPALGRHLFVWAFVFLICSLTSCVALLMAPERILLRRNRLLYRWVGISFVLGILFPLVLHILEPEYCYQMTDAADGLCYQSLTPNGLSR